MNENVAYAVLEEVLRRAMDESLILKSRNDLSEEERGALLAYFNILDWGKQQAEFMELEFGDRELQAFDPYSLLSNRICARSALRPSPASRSKGLIWKDENLSQPSRKGPEKDLCEYSLDNIAK